MKMPGHMLGILQAFPLAYTFLATSHNGVGIMDDSVADGIC